MDKKLILTILSDWNLWQNDIDSGIQRDEYLTQLKSLMSTNQVVAITGPRRAGKSYVMKQMANDLVSRGIDKNRILIVNFEDPRFSKLDKLMLQSIYETYLENLSPSDKPFLFLDEIQEVDEWEKWVNSTHELKKANIVISGSNAKLLSKELSTLLTGRHIDLSVFPLTFREFLSFKKIQIASNMDKISKRTKISKHLSEYLEFGAFPEVTLSNEKRKILIGYFDDIISKDIIKRHQLRNPSDLRELAQFYFTNCSSPITYNSIEKFLKISADTAESYSGYFEDVYFFAFVKRFSYKLKEQLRSPKKVYALDSGLANTIGFRFSENSGKLMENLVYSNLKKLISGDPTSNIYYWKDLRGNEVDFVIKRGLKVKLLIQVCWNLNNPITKNRELRSLRKAMEEFEINTSYIITFDQEGEEKIDGKIIKIIPLSDWLLRDTLPI